MRSNGLTCRFEETDVQRMYFQCSRTEKTDNWSDERIWGGVSRPTGDYGGWELKEGPIFSKSVIRMRSLVVEPMRYGRLLLAGDSAHVVPPTGTLSLLEPDRPKTKVA